MPSDDNKVKKYFDISDKRNAGALCGFIFNRLRMGIGI
jgi:hypothetical protein